jgi:pyochelin synthetase
LVEGGYLEPAGDGYVVARELPRGIPDSLVDRVRQVLTGVLAAPDDLVEWLLSLAGDLAPILVEQVHSAQLYTSNRIPEVYSVLFGPTYRTATDAMRGLVHAWPADQSIRVLEVGGGLGTLTSHLLPLLPAERSEYVFTDISGYFMTRARDTFAEYPFVDCRLFDLNREPERQGLTEHTADVIVAASVLHDTDDVRRTLRQLLRLLTAGGVLLIVEQTRFHPWFDLTMGLQQGFDGFQDTDLRSRHPLLDREQWRTVLAEAGFTQTAVLAAESPPATVGFDVLVAQAPGEQRVFQPGKLKDFLADQLPSYMIPVEVRPLSRLPLSRTGKIDRAALSAVTTQPSVRGRTARQPVTHRQRKLVEIWRDLLRLPHVDIDDDFLHSGGDSLLAARLSAELRVAFEVMVPVSVVLQNPTVRALDGYLDQILGSSPTVGTSVPESA